jgi:amino acid transporter
MATDLEPKGGSHLRQVPQADAEERYQSLGYRAKRALLGPPFKTAQLAHERISKRVALAVFSSDPISSTAYATEEMLLVLIVAGTGAIGLALPLACGVAVLLLILVLSYRQVIAAYPQGGGAYMVTRDNLGGSFAAVCAAALLVDYVLTVAVSVSAGTAALASAIPSLEALRTELSAAFVILLMWGNLRGIRESGKIFAVPTYVYILSLGGVVVLGVYRVLSGQVGDIAYSPAQTQTLAGYGEPLAAVSLFLLMHAYAAGTTALTGVEAIADGVPAFKKPEARNAQRTLVAMALIMGFLFIGITYLAIQLGARPFEFGHPTLVAQVTEHVLGAGPVGHALFVFVQVATLFILVLAANTAFNGFPILASFAAQDALMPRQLRKRGHRLVYSNGILLLAAGAVFLVISFHASVHALIPLYAIGVVTSFTLAQAGMTRRHLRLRQPGWGKGLLINGLGATVTLLVLVVITITKFTHGAWMVVVAVPLLVWLLLRTQRTYRGELGELRVEMSHRLAPPKPRHEVVVLVEALDRATIGALQYARQLNPLRLTALHIAVDPERAKELSALWSRVNMPASLELVDAPDRNLLATTQAAIAELVRPDTEVTVLVPKRRYATLWRRVLHDNSSAGLVRALGSMDGVNVTIVPFRLGRRSFLRPVPPGPPPEVDNARTTSN